MKAVLIYIRETKFENNKFKLDFSDRDQFANSIEFEKNTPYLIATLNCNLQLGTTNTITVKDSKTKTATDKKAISDLSTKSRILLDKGSDYFCDIDSLNLVFSPKGLSYDIVSKENNFYFEKKRNIENYVFKYEFWDETEKKKREAKFILPTCN